MAGNGVLNSMEEAARGEHSLFSHTRFFSDVSGRSSDVVDIFNVKSGTWTTVVLSAARYGLAATSLPNDGLAIFAGGVGALFADMFPHCRKG